MIFIFLHWHSVRLRRQHLVLDQNVAVGSAVADGVLLAVGEQELAVDPVPWAGDQGDVPSPVDGAALQLKLVISLSSKQ